MQIKGMPKAIMNLRKNNANNCCSLTTIDAHHKCGIC